MIIDDEKNKKLDEVLSKKIFKNARIVTRDELKKIKVTPKDSSTEKDPSVKPEEISSLSEASIEDRLSTKGKSLDPEFIKILKRRVKKAYPFKPNKYSQAGKVSPNITTDAKKDAAAAAVNPREKGKDKRVVKDYSGNNRTDYPNLHSNPPDGLPHNGLDSTQVNVGQIIHELTEMIAGLEELENKGQIEGIITQSDTSALIVPMREEAQRLLSSIDPSRKAPDAEQQLLRVEKQRGWFGDSAEHARAAATRGASSGPEPKRRGRQQRQGTKPVRSRGTSDAPRKILRALTTFVGARIGMGPGEAVGQLFSNVLYKPFASGSLASARIFMPLGGKVIGIAAGAFLGSRLFRKPKEQREKKMMKQSNQVTPQKVQQSGDYIQRVIQAIQQMSPQEQERFVSTLTPEESLELRQIGWVMKEMQRFQQQSAKLQNKPGVPRQQSQRPTPQAENKPIVSRGMSMPSIKGVSISKVNVDGTLQKARGWFGDSQEHARVAALRGASSGPEPKKKPKSPKDKQKDNGVTPTADLTSSIGREAKRGVLVGTRRLISNVATIAGDIATDIGIEAVGTLLAVGAIYWASGGRMTGAAVGTAARKKVKAMVRNTAKLPRVKKLVGKYSSFKSLALWAGSKGVT